jgi:hypothetical protein
MNPVPRIHALQVGSDGALTQAETARYLLVGQPRGDEAEHLFLPGTQMDGLHEGTVGQARPTGIG